MPKSSRARFEVLKVNHHLPLHHHRNYPFSTHALARNFLLCFFSLRNFWLQFFPYSLVILLMLQNLTAISPVEVVLCIPLFTGFYTSQLAGLGISKPPTCSFVGSPRGWKSWVEEAGAVFCVKQREMDERPTETEDIGGMLEQIFYP